MDDEVFFRDYDISTIRLMRISAKHGDGLPDLVSAIAGTLTKNIEASRSLLDQGQPLDLIAPLLLERVFLDIKYAGYIEKEMRASAWAAKMDAIKLDSALDYWAIPGLSAE